MIRLKDSTKVLLTVLGLLTLVIDHRLFEIYNKIDVAHKLTAYGQAIPKKYNITIWNLPAILVVAFGIVSLLIPFIKHKKNETESNN